MSATSSLELGPRGPSAVGWSHKNREREPTDTDQSCIQDEQQYIRWYDRRPRAFPDVWWTSLSTRYQGISKAYTPLSHSNPSRWDYPGEVMAGSSSEICVIYDARFSSLKVGIENRVFWNIHRFGNLIKHRPALLKVSIAIPVSITGTWIKKRKRSAGKWWNHNHLMYSL